MTQMTGWLLFAAAALSAAGCQWNPKTKAGGVQVAVDPNRKTDVARRCNDLAASMLERGDLQGAQRELGDAIAADPTYGPAHNNLGLVYYRQKKLYEAAQKFQEAAALMPGKAPPRNNLGLVLEITGKIEDAAKAYEDAHALEPNSMEITGNLARTWVRLDRNDQPTIDLLKKVAQKDTRPAWSAWARQCLYLTRSPASRPAAPAAS